MPSVRVKLVASGETKVVEFAADNTDLYEAVERAFCVKRVQLVSGADSTVVPRDYAPVSAADLFLLIVQPVPVRAGMAPRAVLDALNAFLPPAHPNVTRSVTVASGASLTRDTAGPVVDFPLTVTLTITAAPVGAAGGSRNKRTPRRRSCRKKSPYGRRS